MSADTKKRVLIIANELSPYTEFTDFSTVIAVGLLGQHSRRLSVLLKGSKPCTYDRVIEYDALLRKSFGALLVTDFTDCPLAMCIVASGVHNRILRLHRPWMTRGYRDARYEQATRTCVESARIIVDASRHYGMVIRRQWFLLYHNFGATMVLFIHMLHLIEIGQENSPQDIALQQDLNQLLIFFRGAEQVSNATIRQRATQFIEVLLALRQAEKARRCHGSTGESNGKNQGEESGETIGEVLKRVTEVMASRVDNPQLSNSTLENDDSNVLPLSDQNFSDVASGTFFGNDLSAQQLLQWIGISDEQPIISTSTGGPFNTDYRSAWTELFPPPETDRLTSNWDNTSADVLGYSFV